MIYVDDVLITGNDEFSINDVVNKLKSKFRMKNLGKVKKYLGLNVNYDRENRILKIDQKDAIEKLVVNLI